jgi:hypothetical protein
MKPENFRERTKSLLKLGILCSIGIILLGTICMMLTGREPVTGNVASVTKPMGQPLPSDRYIGSDSILHLHAIRLLVLEERLIRLSDSTALSTADMENAKKEIKREEALLQHMLDTMEGQGAQRRFLAATVRTMLLSQDALNYRHPELAQRAVNVNEKVSSDPDGLLLRDNGLLRRQLEELQQANAVANGQLTNLQHSNENLLIRLNAARSSAGASPSMVSGGSLPAAEVESQNHAVAVSNPSPERNATGESEELLFAQADCNMSRADSRQIVYNARQRKDLLMDALTTLNGLARSPHAEIQTKAKAKIAQLRTIASTIHD